jgi:hypothetical protein
LPFILDLDDDDDINPSMKPVPKSKIPGVPVFCGGNSLNDCLELSPVEGTMNVGAQEVQWARKILSDTLPFYLPRR